jgi:type II secretory pathway component PulF
MPAGRLLQFSVLCGSATSLSTWPLPAESWLSASRLAKSQGQRLGEMQANFGKAVMLLEQFYRGQSDLSETLGVLNDVLSQVAYHRENVIKTGQPELELFGD